MWTDDLDFVESCDFYRSLSNFDSIDSIGAYAATNTIVYMKAPSTWLLRVGHGCFIGDSASWSSVYLGIPNSKVEVVSLPVAELVTKLTQSLQRFVNNCCVTPREGDSWEHHTKPKLILVTSEKISLQVLDNIVGEWTCIEF